MEVKQLQDVYSFRKTGLTCHKWKADTTKLKGVGEADGLDERVGETDDPDEGVGKAGNLDEGVGKAGNLDEGVGEADDPDERVGETDDPDEGVGEAGDPEEVVSEADNLDVALLGLHVCIYKEISCALNLVLIKKTTIRK